LPRPDIPPGGRRDLVDALHELHHRAGWPSLRVLAREAGCSHTTVSAVFSSPRLPTWGVLEVLVAAMDGDLPRFRRLWLAASAPKAASAPADLLIAGRKSELALVRRHLEEGTGLLVIAGEAGMGKTHLVSTASTLVAGSTFVAAGSCLPFCSAHGLADRAHEIPNTVDSTNPPRPSPAPSSPTGQTVPGRSSGCSASGSATALPAGGAGTLPRGALRS
jgi:hypothetical protein